MMTDEDFRETKQEFNKRYGEFMHLLRAEIAMPVETVATITNVDVDAINRIEKGECVELYDALRLCKYYGVESDDRDV